MKNDLKERLNTCRTNKTLVWQTMIVTLGGAIGLLLKALNAGTNPLEIFLIVVGFSLSIFWFYLINCISDDMEKLHKKLKQQEELKNAQL